MLSSEEESNETKTVYAVEKKKSPNGRVCLSDESLKTNRAYCCKYFTHKEICLVVDILASSKSHYQLYDKIYVYVDYIFEVYIYIYMRIYLILISI